tara:strand:+ start:439 stop:759 length:321 start_codon:yes stop_codon:yes gene_type:complete
MPYALAIIIFYSVAIHMHIALKGWPDGIGTRGFPKPLLFHVNIQGWYLSVLGFFTVFVVPIIVLLCLIIPKWRHFSIYFLLQIIGLVIFLLQTYFAPDAYLYWFWD